MALHRQYTSEERSFMVLTYTEVQSLEETRSFFVARFSDGRHPSRTTVLRNSQKYQVHGTSLNRNSGHSGRPRTVWTDNNIGAFRQSIADDPHQSKRRNNFGIGRSSFSRLVKDTKLHPYQMQRRHKLVDGDHQHRLNFCHWFVQVIFDCIFLI